MARAGECSFRALYRDQRRSLTLPRPQDHEIRRSLIVKTEHLLSLFDSPLRVIAKRNDKRLDHQRFTKTKNPADRRGSEEYLGLTTSLMDELPRFLGSVSRYFNIVVEHFGGAQAAYHEAVQERWDAYGDAWLHQIPSGNFKQIEASFLEGHKTVDEMMSTLAKGLGVASACEWLSARSTWSTEALTFSSSSGSSSGRTYDKAERSYVRPQSLPYQDVPHHQLATAHSHLGQAHHTQLCQLLLW